MLVAEALALVLCELTVEQRRELAAPLVGTRVVGLMIAADADKLRGAAWGQRHPGNTAIFWPPQFAGDADLKISRALACAVAGAMDAAGIRMTQALVSNRKAAIIPVLESAGFSCLADLAYLNWEAAATVPQPGEPQNLAFEPFADSQRGRLLELIESTYEGTLDCTAMNGQRPLDEVYDGYRATGDFRPANWQFVRHEGRDVGVLLLADHPAAEHVELMYMGVVPAARGRRFGREIVRHAQRLAFAAGRQRIVLAVDAENVPAIRMYHEAGFVSWDQRTVFVRFLA